MKFLYLVFLILFLQTSVYAEPSHLVNEFIEKPVSMLDWGMFRIERYLNYRGVTYGVEETLISWSPINVTYNKHANAFTVNFYGTVRSSENEKAVAIEAGETVLKNIRSEIWANSHESGRPLLAYFLSGIDEFSPTLNAKNDELNKLFTVHITINARKEAAYHHVHFINEPLFNDRMKF